MSVERELIALADELAFPPTPELAGPIRARLEAPPRRRRLPARRTVALALAALLLLAAAAFAAAPGLRHDVLDWLGLGSVRVVRVSTLPHLPPGPIGRRLGFGGRTTLAGARASAGFPVLVPLRQPDETYFSTSPPGGRVTLAYRPAAGAPRMLVTELRGRQDETLIEKSLGPDTTLERVRVGPDPGIWIAGTPHEFAFADARGRIRAENLRLAGNTLVWRHGDVLLRLEANVSRARALAIARGMR